MPRKDYTDSLRLLPNAKLSCSKSLIEMTLYRGVTMWWWADFGYWSVVAELSNRTREGTITPSTAVRGIRERIRTFVVRNLRRTEIVLMRSLILELVVHFLAGVVATAGERKRRSGPARLGRILFTSEDVEWRHIRDDETGRPRKSDAFFDSTLSKLPRWCECIGVYPAARSENLHSLLQSFRIAVDKCRNWDLAHRTFELYWSRQVAMAERRAYWHFQTVWSNLLHDVKFNEICDRAQTTSGLPVRSILKNHFRVTFPRGVRYLEMAERMIRTESPRLILIEEEYGTPFELALVIAAKKERVPTLALQHGVIYPSHPGYAHLAKPSGENASISSFPIPDTVAVYGPYSKCVLTRLGYPRGSVVITGQPRYDRLSHVRRMYSKRKFVERYGLCDGVVLLWTGEVWEDQAASLTAISKVLRNMKDVTLIIKQHPGQREVFRRAVKQYLGGFESKIIVTSEKSDIYEQLFVTDLVIGKHTTAIMEAVALGKPVVILNLSGTPASVDYVREGVGLEVDNEEDLGPTIKRLLKDDSELSRNRKKFVEKYLHRIDGNSSQRVANLACRMIGLGGPDEE